MKRNEHLLWRPSGVYGANDSLSNVFLMFLPLKGAENHSKAPSAADRSKGEQQPHSSAVSKSVQLKRYSSPLGARENRPRFEIQHEAMTHAGDANTRQAFCRACPQCAVVKEKKEREAAQDSQLTPHRRLQVRLPA